MGQRVPDRLVLVDREIDLVRRVVVVEGVEQPLQPREVDLLTWFLAHPVRPASREELLREVWGYRAAARTRVVDMTVRRLRARIELDPAQPRHLLTVRGVGYRLELEGIEVRREPRADSLALVEPWQLTALAQLAVFEGPFPSSAASELLDLSGEPEAPPPWQVLQALLSAGLLRREDGLHSLAPDRRARAWARVGAQDRIRVEERHAAWAVRLRGDAARRFLADVLAATARALDAGDLVLGPEGAKALASAGHSDPLGSLLASQQARIEGLVARAAELAQSALERAEAVGDPALMARALRTLAWQFNGQGRLSEAAALLERALPAAQQAQDHAVLVRVHTDLAINHLERGDQRRATLCLAPADAACRAAGDPPRARADVCMTRGIVALGARDHGAAVAAFTDADARYSELGEPRGRAWALNNLGESYRQAGDAARARSLYVRAGEWFRVAEDPSVWFPQCNLALLDMEAGAWALAVPQLDGLLLEARSAGRAAREARAALLRAACAVAQGDREVCGTHVGVAAPLLARTRYADRVLAETAETAAKGAAGCGWEDEAGALRRLALAQWRALREPERAAALA